MENQCQNLTMTQRNALIKLLQILKDFLMKHLAPRKKFIRLRVKVGCEANMLATIISTEGT